MIFHLLLCRGKQTKTTTHQLG